MIIPTVPVIIGKKRYTVMCDHFSFRIEIRLTIRGAIYSGQVPILEIS